MNFSPRPTAPKNFNTWHQNGFWWPRNTAVIALNRTPSTKVDLSWFKFVLQMHWPKSARWTGILIDKPNLKYKPIYKAQICIFLKTAKALHEMETVHVQEMIEYNNCHHKDWPWKKKKVAKVSCNDQTNIWYYLLLFASHEHSYPKCTTTTPTNCPSAAFHSWPQRMDDSAKPGMGTSC